MRRILSYVYIVVYIVIFIAAHLSGCGKSREDSSPAVSLQPQGGQSDMSSLPLVTEPVTFTYWIEYLGLRYLNESSSLDAAVSFRELERRTGIHIEFIHPSSDDLQNEFKLMMASRDLPDLVANPLDGYPGGIESAIDNRLYVPLNDYLEDYAPNYLACITKTEERMRDAKTDNGYYAAFWQINDPVQGPWIGPAVRKDWLNEAGLETPVTISDWETMLRAFRDQIGSKTPYKLDNSGTDIFSNILSAFGVGRSFYRVGSTVYYGPSQKAYFDYLDLMHAWYEERLVNPSFYNQRGVAYIASMPDDVGACSVMYTAIGKGNKYNRSIDDPNAHTAAVPYPVLEPGDKIHIRRHNLEIAQANTSVTTACRDIITAIRWLDFGYSDEGAMIINFGVEGQTFIYEDGQPRLSHLITDNPDGLSPQEALSKLLINNHASRYYWWRELPLVSEEGLEAIEDIWTIADADYVMPPVTLSPKEGRKFEKKGSIINVGVQEIELQHFSLNLDKNIEHNVKIL